MAEDGSERPNAAKKKYEKPEIARVPLKPEEAVLGACKTSGVGGPVDSSCGQATMTPCMTAGS